MLYLNSFYFPDWPLVREIGAMSDWKYNVTEMEGKYPHLPNNRIMPMHFIKKSFNFSNNMYNYEVIFFN